MQVTFTLRLIYICFIIVVWLFVILFGVKMRKGNAVIEYVLVASLIALLSISNLDNLENKLGVLIDAIASEVEDTATAVSI